MPKKSCLICNERKPFDAFYIRADKKYGAMCLQCCAQASLYDEGIDDNEFGIWLCIGRKPPVALTTYGFTLEELKYLRAFEVKGCFACGLNDRKLRIDHDHKTGKVRGLLCNSCNVKLGKLRDNPPNGSALAKYISRANHTSYAKTYKQPQ